MTLGTALVRLLPFLALALTACTAGTPSTPTQTIEEGSDWAAPALTAPAPASVLEARVLSWVRAAGLVAYVTEPGFQDATVAVDLASGGIVGFHLVPQESPAASWQGPRRSATVAGQAAEWLSGIPDGPILRFTCGPYYLDVSAYPPDGQQNREVIRSHAQMVIPHARECGS